MSRALLRTLSAICLVGPLTTSLASAQSPPAVQPLSACAAAMECGLTPEALVIADAAADASSILGRLESATALRTLLALQRATLDSASAACGDLMRQVAAADTEIAEAQASARTALAAAQSALVATRAEVFEQATQGLSQTKIDHLTAWRASAGASVPAAYRARSASEVQWQKIEGALRSEQRAARRGEALDEESAALLASVRGDLEVIAAAARLEQQLTAVQASYADCLSTQSP